MLKSCSEIENFLYVDRKFVTPPKEQSTAALLALLDTARGQFSVMMDTTDGDVVLARDPLGVNKLFFALKDGDVVAANFVQTLLDQGINFKDVWSVPAGGAVIINTDKSELTLHNMTEVHYEDDAETNSEEAARVIRKALEATIDDIAELVKDRACYVALSGGLDSSTVAALAAPRIPGLKAVTFSLDFGEDEVSEDMLFARRVAEELGIELIEVTITPDKLVDMIDTVLVMGQDWREFNVHCALVNATLGQALQPADDSRPVILTGDTMNEIMIDYKPEEYGGRTLYALPDMPTPELRKVLVRGLDAGDREVGIFHHFGLATIQPYAWCIDQYAKLGPDMLGFDMAKQSFAKQAFGDVVPSYIFDRPKVRAQCGSADRQRGTLAATVDHGIDQGTLQARIGELWKTDLRSLRKFLLLGRYRMPSRWEQLTRPVAK